MGIGCLDTDHPARCTLSALQVAKFIPRGVILQYLGAQREIYLESPAAAALSQYMPSPKASESSRVVKSPMTGHLVQVCSRVGAGGWDGDKEQGWGDQVGAIWLWFVNRSMKYACTGCA